MCSLCHGLGTLFVVQNGVKEWWECCACGGGGVRFVYGPPLIKIHSPRKKKSTGT